MEKELELYEISRREFLKGCAFFAALIGVSQVEFTKSLAYSLEKAKKKPPLI